MSDTIFYKGKLKRTKTPADVFAKIQKAVKKKGPAKNWVCTIDDENQSLLIDFNDGKSETFGLSFDGLEFNDFCKVYFPLDGELFEDGKSEFKALLDVLYSAKSMFSKIEITDDYCLAETYWAEKRFKIKFRELTEGENKRIRRLFDAGYTTREDIIKAVIAEDMGIPVDELEKNINPCTSAAESVDSRFDRDVMDAILETYLYEATTFRNGGRTCEQLECEYYDLSAVLMSVCDFMMGITGLTGDLQAAYEDHWAPDPKSSQIKLMFREKFYPAYQAENDGYKQCILSYRFFLSVLEYSGFQYVGRMNEPRTSFEDIIKQYGEEKGNLFITVYCTTSKFIFPLSDKEEKLRLADTLIRNICNTYSEEILDEYLEFKKEFQKQSRFRKKTDYVLQHSDNYVDESLLSG